MESNILRPEFFFLAGSDSGTALLCVSNSPWKHNLSNRDWASDPGFTAWEVVYTTLMKWFVFVKLSVVSSKMNRNKWWGVYIPTMECFLCNLVDWIHSLLEIWERNPGLCWVTVLPLGLQPQALTDDVFSTFSHYWRTQSFLSLVWLTDKSAGFSWICNQQWYMWKII